MKLQVSIFTETHGRIEIKIYFTHWLSFVSMTAIHLHFRTFSTLIIEAKSLLFLPHSYRPVMDALMEQTNIQNGFYDINSNEKDPNKTKRIRTRFTVEQLEKLEGRSMQQ